MVDGNDPNVKYLKPQFFGDYDSQRVQIKYGPFETPACDIDGGMRKFKTKHYTPPCQNCLITWMHAVLEYPDGTHANADTGLWLHHTLLVNIDKKDTRDCGHSGERFFASGNERTVVDLSLSG